MIFSNSSDDYNYEDNFIQPHRFFPQIKGTTMGTPMAVNFANVFMGRFERRMLQDYERIYMAENQWPGYAILTIFYFYGMETKYL